MRGDCPNPETRNGYSAASVGTPSVIVGAENLRQAIFVNHAPGAIAPLDPELIQIRDAVGQLP
jgi:hypothetical protein